MATYTQTVNKIEDRVIGFIEQVDDLAVSGATKAGEWIGDVLPSEIPGSDYLRRLPKPEEYVRLYWNFIERLVKTQKSFSLNMVKAFHPVTGKIWPAQVRKAA